MRMFHFSRRIGGLLLLALLLCLLPLGASAAVNCTITNNTLSIGNVSVSPSAPVGTVLATSGTAPITISCTGMPYDNTAQGKVVTMQAGNLAPRDPSDPPSGGGIAFDTNVQGVALVVTATPVQASDSACLRCGPGSTAGFEAVTVNYPTTSATSTFTAKLVKTGPITPGALGSIQLMQFWWYIYGKTSSVGPLSSLTFSGGNVSVIACSVNTDSQTLNVALPPVSTSALTAVGATAATTAFKINLSCQSGSNVSITLATSTPGTGAGVIAPATGTGKAANVGVRLLDGSRNPVTFNTAKSLGATPNGTLSIPYYAQYYLTATPAGSGQVTATATYTLTYQ
ncbi:type 1 fimbria pilin [Dyella sp. SG562]|uniref:fimbrial protein n=1 Tax=unclassified Dyella TaxID=2634549 RepID=UPI00142357E9|nr:MULTISPECIES: fimbrial protein [unclassified Dyella]NII73450.1 type 1 fimbria pilin [Dyella sp. SG562]